MIKRLRLATGIVLFVYVAMHFLNHALGLVSLEAAQWGRDYFHVPVWRNPVGTTLLYGSLIVHFALALWALYARRTLRMHAWEWMQLVLGFVIPLGLVEHVIGTRIVNELFGTVDDYRYITLVLWVWQPEKGIQQSALLLVAWLHGTIGLHYWLRLKPWYRGATPLLLSAAVLIPFLGLLGFNQMGRETVLLVKDAEALRDTTAMLRLPNRENAAFLYAVIDAVRIGVLGAIALTLFARMVRSLDERRRGLVRVTYPGGKTVLARPGATLLEISREAGIPHASVCGGRGRCSTCRIRIPAGAENLPVPAPEEQRVLDRIKAPPQVRLACQLRPSKPLEVVPLLPPGATPREAFARPDYSHGRDQVIAVLFADLRAFTEFSEQKLPYDVVFVLNRYFAAMGEAIAEAGGHLDKFIGDGVMALFGIGGDTAGGCRAALSAANRMALKLEELNHTLRHDLPRPLRIGIGIHAGHAIVGEMGHGRAVSLTAIGDTVNTASRLETVTKELAVQLVVSEDLEKLAGVDLGVYPRHQVSIRGRQQALSVRAIADASALELRAPGRRAHLPEVARDAPLPGAPQQENERELALSLPPEERP
jgi:adenylate cyclase